MGIVSIPLDSALALAAALAVLTPAAAQGAGRPSQVSVSGEVTLVSDYRWRGISQSDAKPAVQADLEIGVAKGWFAGLWGSAEIGSRRRRAELDIYAGRAGKFVGLDYSAAGYLYLDGDMQRLNYAELRATVSRDFGSLAMQAEASVSTPEVRRGAGNLYLGVTATTPVGPSGLRAVLHIGREDGFYRRKTDYEIGARYGRRRWSASASIIGCLHRIVPDDLARTERHGGALVVTLTRAL